MTELPKVYTPIKKVGQYTIAAKRTDRLFYVFNADGGVNTEAAFTTVERAEDYIPTIDHCTVFTAKLARSGYVPSWRKGKYSAAR